ncbi:hypothetical protein [Rhizobium mongolense]|uniref:Glycosyl transferase family 29 (Putative sialyltransferase) n=1 Tax=Rhizobium mongolense TaxID=57676 RepID=A0A7W6RQB7_9HYPH|nr:hypothetical protein [Rhizobium mongolense]MBB4276715.1 hypothetical protein [Rhizobium mongolense]
MTYQDVDKLCFDLRRVIAGRKISLVGNAASLLSSRYGAQIDDGCVVRINSGVPIRPAAQGRRVDIHCFSTRSSFLYNMGRASWRVRLKRRYFDNAFSVWMSAVERDLCENPQQAFYPIALLDDLTARLGAPPSIGSRALHMLTELTEAEVWLFGFDFKESTSFYRQKENRGPHDWAAEREYAYSLVRDGRIVLVR